MPVLDHTIVHSSDRFAGAKFLTDLLDLPEAKPAGIFAAVRLDDGAALDYCDELVKGKDWVPTHYAFKVTEAEFDAVLARIQDRGLPYWADPHNNEPQRINHWGGGRGVYVDDPDGHRIEFLTVSL